MHILSCSWFLHRLLFFLFFPTTIEFKLCHNDFIFWESLWYLSVHLNVEKYFSSSTDVTRQYLNTNATFCSMSSALLPVNIFSQEWQISLKNIAQSFILTIHIFYWEKLYSSLYFSLTGMLNVLASSLTVV